MISYMLRPALRKYAISQERNESLIEKIFNETCITLGTDKKKVLGRGRYKELCMTRHITTFLWKKHLKMTHKEAGKRLGGRDHTTSINSLKQMKGWLETEPDLHMTINLIENKIQ